MNIILDIGYDLVGRKPGNQRTKSYRFRDTVSAEIPEVNSAEAPIAVSWQAQKHSDERWGYFDQPLRCGDEYGTILTRWYAGRHWLRLVDGNCGKRNAPSDTCELDMSLLKRAVSDERERIFLLLGLREFMPLRAKASVDPKATLEEVSRDGRMDAIQAVAAISDNVISVDGVIHVACAQPGIRTLISQYYQDFPFHEKYLAVDTRSGCLDGHAAFLSGLVTYPLNDWDSIYERLVQESSEFRTSPPESHLRAPQVFIPESIDPDIDARRAVDTLVKKVLYSRAVVSAPDRNREVHEFFASPSNQRKELLEALLYSPSATLPEGIKIELLDKVEEIEDGMSISLEVTGARPCF